MNLRNLFYFLPILFLFAACSDEPGHNHEEELITNVEVTLSSGSTTYTMTFSDIDGDGGAAPVIVADTLPDSTTFIISIELSNASVSPAEDITAEILAEADEHQFFFQVSGVDASTTYTDTDINNYPLGLAGTLTTNAAGDGTIRVTLRHEPDKAATGVAGGDITNAGGSTDVEVDFPLIVR